MQALAIRTPFAPAGQTGAQPPTDSTLAILAKLLNDARAAFAHDVNVARDCVDSAVDLLFRTSPASDMRQPEDSRSGLATWQAAKVERFVSANIEQTIRVDDLAAIVRLSRSYFSKAFRRTFDMSPHDYVMGCRVEQAKDMMLTTQEPLCQISAACGLTDQAHLSRLFKRATGLSPNMWRRRKLAERSGALSGAV